MQQAIGLSPRELYFLGGILKARYIDYVYISAMGDVQKHFQAHRRQALRTLTEKNLLREDFSGNITLADGVELILKPVFFGPMETTVQLYLPGQGQIRTWRLHQLEQAITLVEMADDEISLQIAGERQLEHLIRTLLPQTKAQGPIRPLDKMYVRRVVTVRQARVGAPAHEEIWIEQDGIMYRDDHKETTPLMLTADAFAQQMLMTMKGEREWEATK